MTDLAATLRDAARGARSPSRRPTVDTRQTSADGTTKFLLELDDGRHIEAVYIPDTPAQTFCISTQVGCAMACAFCLTGKMGLVRHLTAGEIAGQVRVLAHETGLAGTAFNIVLMGMGEPLHNYDATMKALRILADEQGLARASAARHAVDGRRRAGARAARDRAADAESRDLAARDDRRAAQRARADQQALRPRGADRRLPRVSRSRKRRRITFEYVLLDRRQRHARGRAAARARCSNGIKAKVNLLPLNEAAGHSVHAAVRRTRERVRARSSPIAACACRCARAAAATSARPAVS